MTPSSGAARCSSGSSWSRCWRTPTTAPPSPGPGAAWSSSSSSPRRWVHGPHIGTFEVEKYEKCFHERLLSFWFWQKSHVFRNYNLGKICIRGMSVVIVVLSAGRPEMGDTEEQTSDELWQAQQISEILLRKGNHAEGGGREIRLQVCL